MVPKKTVAQSIEQKIYNLIHDLLESKSAEKRANLEGDSTDLRSQIASAYDLKVSEVLEYVQLKDFQMRRTKRVQLEKVILDMLKVVTAEEDEDFPPPEVIDIESEEEARDDLMEVKDTNYANKGVTALWNSTGPVTNSDRVNSKNNTPIEESKKRPSKEEPTQIIKKRKSKIDHTPPETKLSSMGGMEKVTAQLMELIGLPILHPEIYLSTGIEPPRGVLLYGPPGCGKTTIANALAGELQVPFINVSAPSIVSGMSGESEKKLREIFEEAKTLAPCIIFMDEIDAITPKRDGGAQREMERRIVAQLLTLMDELTIAKTNGKPVVVIGATNRPDSLDSALRRAGRFDREICLEVPNEDQRSAILEKMTQGLKLDRTDNFNFKQLSKMTPGYVGADLKSLVTAAGIAAIKRIFEGLSEEDYTAMSSVVNGEAGEANVETNGDANDADLGTDGERIIDLTESTSKVTVESDSMEVDQTVTTIVQTTQAINKTAPAINPINTRSLSTIQRFLLHHPNPLTDDQLAPLSITFQDFINALPTIQPTAKREGFATVPDVTWANVGALHHIRMELHMCIVQPIKKPELYLKVGISAPSGVLMWGPPGCGKTLLAKAVANESRANFISVKGPELLNKYVGESERAVRQVFQRARASRPCIIFFDELDALVPSRGASLSESSSRVVNTLLTELDGLAEREGIYVIGATNRPDMIDPAMLRPGRLDKTLYIELPTAPERFEILKTLVRANNTPMSPDVDLAAVANDPQCRNFSGADMSSLLREAAVLALKKKFFHGQKILDLDESGYFEEDESVVDNEISVTNQDFKDALMSIKPSVSDRDRAKYEKLNKRMGWNLIQDEEPKDATQN